MREAANTYVGYQFGVLGKANKTITPKRYFTPSIPHTRTAAAMSKLDAWL